MSSKPSNILLITGKNRTELDLIRTVLSKFNFNTKMAVLKDGNYDKLLAK